MKKLLLTFDTTSVSRDALTKLLEDIEGIPNWVAFLPGCIALDSTLSIEVLTKRILTRFPNLFFVFSEIDPEHVGGRLPKRVWDYVNGTPALHSFGGLGMDKSNAPRDVTVL